MEVDTKEEGPEATGRESVSAACAHSGRERARVPVRAGRRSSVEPVWAWRGALVWREGGGAGCCVLGSYGGCADEGDGAAGAVVVVVVVVVVAVLREWFRARVSASQAGSAAGVGEWCVCEGVLVWCWSSGGGGGVCIFGRGSSVYGEN